MPQDVRNPAPSRVMAPWWTAPSHAVADGVFTLRDFKKTVLPYADRFRRDEHPRAALEGMINGKPTHWSPRVTEGAQKAISELTGVEPQRLGKLFYYTPTISKIDWQGGWQNRLELTAQFSRIDVNPEYKVNVDVRARTITIRLRGTDHGEVKISILPEPTTLSLKVPGLQDGKRYTVIVRDDNPRSAKAGRAIAQKSFVFKKYDGPMPLMSVGPR